MSPSLFPDVTLDDLVFNQAVELAMIMDRLYGGVCYAGIDTDPELKYPKVTPIILYLLKNLLR